MVLIEPTAKESKCYETGRGKKIFSKLTVFVRKEKASIKYLRS
jgi:hypothetical protein